MFFSRTPRSTTPAVLYVRRWSVQLHPLWLLNPCAHEFRAWICGERRTLLSVLCMIIMVYNVFVHVRIIVVKKDMLICKGVLRNLIIECVCVITVLRHTICNSMIMNPIGLFRHFLRSHPKLKMQGTTCCAVVLTARDIYQTSIFFVNFQDLHLILRLKLKIAIIFTKLELLFLFMFCTEMLHGLNNFFISSRMTVLLAYLHRKIELLQQIRHTR